MSKPGVVLVCLGLVLLCGIMFDGRSPPANVKAGAKPAAGAGVAETIACEIPYELIEARCLDPKMQAMDRVLRKPISIEIREQPLKEALRLLETQTSVRIVPDPDLRETGSAEAIDAPVSVMAKDVPLKQVLRQMLSPLGLIAIADSQQIDILDSRGFCGRLETKIYPVADLIAYRAEDRVQIVREGLIEFLTSIVQPESWDEVGGPGSIRFEPITMSFVVRQTEAVHDEIEDCLRTLREARCRLPKLVHAAGSPSVAEIRKAERSLERAELELAQIEKSVRNLEGIDPKTVPNALGAGFFDVARSDGAPEAPAWNGGVSRHSVINEARKLAVRAMRIIVRFEFAIENENRKQSESLQNDEQTDATKAAAGPSAAKTAEPHP